MTALDIVYASAPASEVIIKTIEIVHPDIDPIRICNGFEDHTLTLEDESAVTFNAAGIDVLLPKSDNSGQQSLRFAIDNVTGEAQRAIDAILESDQQGTITYREYLSSDLSAPASNPITLTIVGGTFSAGQVSIDASYFDLLNSRWPRAIYDANFAPAIKYIA